MEEEIDVRLMNMMIQKPGGTAGKGSLTYKIAIPSVWAKTLGVTEENRQLQMSFDGEKIVIEKVAE